MDSRYTSRRSRLRQIMSELEIPISIITSWPNIFYFTEQRPIGALTNSWSPNALLLAEGGDYRFVCTRAYSKMIEIEGIHLSTVPFSEDPLIWPNRSVAEAIKMGIDQLVGGTAPKQIGIEAGRMAVSLADALRTCLPGSCLIPVGEVITGLRCRKDDQELQFLREASQITNFVFKQVVQTDLRAGMTEIELEKAFIRTIADAGAAPAFIQIFTGKRSCYQNISPSSRVIEKGDTVLIDFGVRCDSGYCSDITRAAVIGPPSSLQVEICDVVGEILTRVLSEVRPGVAASDLDEFNESQFRELGYEDYYIHRVGHNVGLEFSEPFTLFRTNTDNIIQSGMCLSLEPGIYKDGVGIRLEDNIIVTEDGYENLTDIPYGITTI